ncbi:MAG: hypothetical protein ACRDQH_06935 [Pseudonocardiaceae bacterium]
MPVDLYLFFLALAVCLLALAGLLPASAKVAAQAGAVITAGIAAILSLLGVA